MPRSTNRHRVEGRRDASAFQPWPGADPLRPGRFFCSGRCCSFRGVAARGQGPESPKRARRLATAVRDARGDRELDGRIPRRPIPSRLRAETLERLKEYEPATDNRPRRRRPDQAGPQFGLPRRSPPASDTASRATAPSSLASDPAAKKPLPALLQDRLRWLNEYEAASLALQKATHPEPSPEQQAAEAKAELLRLQSILSRPPQAPETLLPPLFRDRRSRSRARSARR